MAKSSHTEFLILHIGIRYFVNEVGFILSFTISSTTLEQTDRDDLLILIRQGIFFPFIGNFLKFEIYKA